eukprot:m.79420 g.79420  ORF g.79420 m.79420 type:complete len:190 (-) comp12566_c1_seq5:4796-5365(-)
MSLQSSVCGWMLLRRFATHRGHARHARVVPVARGLTCARTCATAFDAVQRTPSGHVRLKQLNERGASGSMSSSSKLRDWSRLHERLKALFIPTEASPAFVRYSAWQAVHMCASTAAGVLSMQALLYAVGIGQGAVPLAAAINWILKDGVGQFGGLLYGRCAFRISEVHFVSLSVFLGALLSPFRLFLMW